ncbi:hypothetical protein HY797_00845 [Candidatus Falkowbacteria bacterium]|nr:hypothetical protein [Candidatus Falkowbacteria bacterium]
MKQNFFKKVITAATLLFLAVLIFAPVKQALAVDSDDYWGGNDLKTYTRDNSGLGEAADRDPRQVAADIIKFILGFLGIIAVIIVLYAGFKWMTAGGNEENVAAAKKMLINGIIGLIIILSAYALTNFILNQIVSATTGTPLSQ